MAMESSRNACDYSHNVTFFYILANKSITEEWETRDFVVVGLGLTVCLIIILANMMVMTAIFINRRYHFPIYYLLCNMAAADLFAGIAYTNLMFNTGPWTIQLSKHQWFVRGALVDFSLTASVANLLAVAVERHQTIVTMQLHSKMSKRRVVLFIVCIWAVAIIMALVPIYWNCECDLDNCSIITPLYSRHYLIFWAALNLLTFSIMVVMYTSIFIYVRRKTHRMSQYTHETANNETVVNLMKTIFMVLGAFVICWTPGLMTLLLDGLLGKDSHALKYEKYCLVLAECNSLINPIIYSLRDKEMRRTFKWIFCCLRRRDHQGEIAPAPFDKVQPESPQENIGCAAKSEEDKSNCALQTIYKPLTPESWTMPGGMER